MYWSQPPYTAWEGGDLQVKCDAPVICRTAGREYLAGRGRLPGAESSSNPTQFQGGEWGRRRQRHHGPLLPHQRQGRTDPLLLAGWRRLLSGPSLPRARQAGDLVLLRCRLLDGFGQTPAFCRIPLQSLGKRYLLGRNRGAGRFPIRPKRRTPTKRSSYTRSAPIRRMSSMPYSIIARRSRPTPRPTAVNRFESYPSALRRSAFSRPNPAIELHSMPCS